MDRKTQKKLSKFLSYVLRHAPETLGLELDENGWAGTQQLLDALGATGPGVSMEELRELVETNDKKRFAFSADQSKIRASQGHSISVDLNLQAVAPPEVLFHGTAVQNLGSIIAHGLRKGERQFVHLSANAETAKQTGGRHGKPVVLNIAAAQMHAEGFTFYLSENNVWLTDNVPAGYVSH